MATGTRDRVVSQKVARAVLFSRLVGDTNLGIDGGDWAKALIELICKSDQANRELLAKVYPEWVLAVNAVQHEHWGIDWLREISREVAQ